MLSIAATGGPKPPYDKKSAIAITIGTVAILWLTFGPSIVILLKD